MPNIAMNCIVYDSEYGRTVCPRCQKAIARCKCAPARRPVGDGIVRVRREVRRGKPVTVVIGLPLSEPELRELAKFLKQKCGCGGAAKDGQIEIQGDQRDVLVRELEARGYAVKLAGG